MDSIVTRLVSEYEDEGITIDKIKVTSNLTTEDLYCLIAINSAVNEQNLNLMNVEDIRSLCISRLSVNFAVLDHNELMVQMGLYEEKKIGRRCCSKRFPIVTRWRNTVPTGGWI